VKGVVNVSRAVGVEDFDLECHGFTLRRKFPQNVCCLRDGTVLLCEKFVKDRRTEAITIEGRKALFQTELYADRESRSRDVGLCLVTGFSAQTSYVPADMIRMKCAPFPASLPKLVDYKQPFVMPEPNETNEWSIVGMVE
jgi:hypothetical protein